MTTKTGNFFIEMNTYYYKKKLLKKSGLLSTHSKYYILINDNNEVINYYVIDTKKLKNLIKTNGKKKTCLNRKSLIYSNGYAINKEIIKINCDYYFTENY